MILLDHEQGSDEWYAARAGVITASRFSDVLAKIRTGEAAARYNYKAELVAERLTGIKTSSYTTAEMQWGIDHEAEARTIYQMIYADRKVNEVGLMLHDKLPAGASLDATVDDDGTVEIKCPNTATHLATVLSGTYPTKYYAQMQGGLWISGRKWCDFISFDPRLDDRLAFYCVRVPRDEEYIQKLELEVTQFNAEIDDMLKELAKL